MYIPLRKRDGYIVLPEQPVNFKAQITFWDSRDETIVHTKNKFKVQ